MHVQRQDQHYLRAHEDRPQSASVRILLNAPVQHEYRQLDAERDVSYRSLRQRVE